MVRALSELVAFRGPIVPRGKAGGILTSLGVAAVLVSCLPTEPCACVQPPPYFVIFGSVQRNSAPVASARVQFSATTATATGACAAGGDNVMLEREGFTTAEGTFRKLLRSIAGEGSHCLRVTAFAGQPGASDSGVVDGLIVQFRNGGTGDSLGVQLNLP